MEELFIWILDGVNAQYRRELEAIRAYSSFKDVVYTRPLLRISHLEAVDMLTKAGNTILDPCCDLKYESYSLTASQADWFQSVTQ